MMNEFVTCEITDFIDHYMPFAPLEEHVKQCIASYMAGEDQQSDNCVFEIIDDKLVFVTAPKLSEGCEDTTYAPLKNIAEAIDGFEAPEGRQRNELVYHHCPYEKIEGEIEGCAQLIDACFCWKSPNNTVLMSDIAVVMKYTLKNGNTVQNHRQLLSMNVYSMNNDICRMNIFGITIRSDKVRIWFTFSSRSHSAVSAQFSFVTVSRYFRTLKPLSLYRSNNITGRMTRVWLVNEVDASGKLLNSPPIPLVLKDVWLDHRSRTEKELQADIFQDIENFFLRDNSIRPKLPPFCNKYAKIVRVRTGEYKKYFLSIVTDCTGETSKAIPDNSESAKDDLLFDEQSDTPIGTTVVKPGTRVTTAPCPTAAVSNATRTAPMRSFTPRRQYRVVFSEVCETIGSLKTLGQVVTALSSVLIPLQLLLGAGWVHRDISCGNIMVHAHGNNQVKLADLEYAKKFPPAEGNIAAADPKTGTWYYMPTEIVQERRIYVPPPEQPHIVNSFNRMRERRRNPKKLDPSSKTNNKQPIFHNFLHDLESVFWIFVRGITTRLDIPAARELAEELFDRQKRFDLFRNSDENEDGIEEKLIDVLPTQLRAFPGAIEELRYLLNNGFAIREMYQRVLEHFDYAIEYTLFATVLEELLESKEAWGDYPLLVQEFVYAKPSQRNGANKRARESDECIPGKEGALDEGDKTDSVISGGGDEDSTSEDSVPARPRKRTAKRSRLETL